MQSETGTKQVIRVNTGVCERKTNNSVVDKY